MPGSKFNEALVGRVADALQAVVVRQARERIQQYEFPGGQIEAAFNIAKSEADRSASILLFALAEDLMLGCFKEHMNPDVHGGWEAVTGSNGVLATVSDRISLLELLYVDHPGAAVGGYIEFEAETDEEAVRFASQIPAARQGGAIEIRPSQIYW